jgi:hypothetical protein
MSYLVPSAKQDDRLTRLEAQVAYLAERLGVSPEELDRHDEKPLPEEVRRLVADGHEVQAIRAYRESTGASLEAARRAVGATG